MKPTNLFACIFMFSPSVSMIRRLSVTTLLVAWGLAVVAQNFDADPTVTLKDKAEKVKFNLGGRMTADAALYSTEFTSMQSGATMPDNRIKAALEYGEKWLLYCDFGFRNGKFTQKDIFMQYLNLDSHDNKIGFKLGYYNDPAGGMAQIVSLGGNHFIGRSGVSNLLGQSLELGTTFKYYGQHLYTEQGVFVDNESNSYEHGNNGLVVAGRWLLRNIQADKTWHAGVSARVAHIGGGELIDDTKPEKGNLMRTLDLAQTMETYVDKDSRFVSCSIPWADNTADFRAEALYCDRRLFARGEYFHKMVTRERGETLNFNGAYVEGGAQILGKGYSYDSDEAVMKGNKSRTLEVVGRLSYSNLTNRDITGGRIFSATLGINYAINKYVQLMLDYSYHNLDNPAFPKDKNFSILQTRAQFVF